MAIAMGSLELVSMRIKEEPFDTSNTITRYTRKLLPPYVTVFLPRLILKPLLVITLLLKELH